MVSQGARVQFQVRELRSNMLRNAAKKKKRMVSQLVFERPLSNGFNYGYLNLHLRIC